MEWWSRLALPVIPAKAGIPCFMIGRQVKWVPAFAVMTGWDKVGLKPDLRVR